MQLRVNFLQMMNKTNKCIKKASDLITTHEAQRNGFLEYALRKSKEAIPYIDKAKALKLILEEKTQKPKDILQLAEIKNSCYEASGVSVAAVADLVAVDNTTKLDVFEDAETLA